jgi:TP901 family phage tail tape measure protein
MMSKLANMESSVATEKLTAVMNGFNLTAEQSIGVLDRLIVLDNNYATSTQEIITAMQRSSNVAQSVGVDFEHLAAYISIVSAKTRQSAETIGESFKTMFTRMSTIKMGKYFEDETQTISDVERALSQPGVEISLRKTNNEFRDMQDVIKEIGERWGEFDDMQQSTISTAIAGVRQADRFKALMLDYPEIAHALAIEMDSAGLAAERYRIQLESSEAATNRLTAAWEGFAMSVLNSDVLIFAKNWVAAILDSVTGLSWLDSALLALSANPIFAILEGIYGLITGKAVGIWKLGADVFKYMGDIKMGTALGGKSSLTTSGAKSPFELEPSEGSYTPTSSLSSSTQELSDNQKAYNDLLKMTIDMLKDKANAEKDALKDELDGYKDIIDARKKILDQMKEEKDYQDELAEKNKDLSDIENELLEIQFDNSEWAKKRRLELEEEKSEKIKDIENLQLDKSIDDQKEALDKEYDDYERYINAKIDALDDYLAASGDLTNEAIALLSEKSAAFYQELIEWNRKFGTGVDTDVTGKWEKAFSSIITFSNGATGALRETERAAMSTAEALARMNDLLANYYRASKDEDKDIRDALGLPPLPPIGQYHSGGIVGGLPKIKESETFAKLLKGEVVANDSQMKNFINSTLPNLVASVSGGGGININMPINVAGSLDKSVLPELRSTILDTINKAMQIRGMKRSPNTFGL